MSGRRGRRVSPRLKVAVDHIPVCILVSVQYMHIAVPAHAAMPRLPACPFLVASSVTPTRHPAHAPPTRARSRLR